MSTFNAYTSDRLCPIICADALGLPRPVFTAAEAPAVARHYFDLLVEKNPFLPIVVFAKQQLISFANARPQVFSSREIGVDSLGNLFGAPTMIQLAADTFTAMHGAFYNPRFSVDSEGKVEFEAAPQVKGRPPRKWPKYTPAYIGTTNRYANWDPIKGGVVINMQASVALALRKVGASSGYRLSAEYDPNQHDAKINAALDFNYSDEREEGDEPKKEEAPLDYAAMLVERKEEERAAKLDLLAKAEALLARLPRGYSIELPSHTVASRTALIHRIKAMRWELRLSDRDENAIEGAAWNPASETEMFDIQPAVTPPAKRAARSVTKSRRAMDTTGALSFAS